MSYEVKPLYRKVNTRARNVHHQFGGDTRHDRHTKKGMSKNLKSGERGLDYTPLYRFLLSKVGQEWSSIHSEAVSRLDKEEPIYHIVARTPKEKEREYSRCGESSIYSRLFVDDDGLLQKINPNLKNEDFEPSCTCCTHTFNGVVLQRKYKPTVYNPADPKQPIRITTL